MNRFKPFVAMAFVCLFLWIQNSFADLKLEDRWRSEEAQPLSRMSASTQRLLNGKPVLFVKGILHELAQVVHAYYYANERAARSLNMDVYDFGPSSWISVPDNSEIITQKIKTIYKATHQAVTVIGHSKGGAEVLYAYLKHPELQSKVDRLVVVQGSVHGSALADEDLRWRMAGLSFITHPSFMSFFEWPGMRSLYPANMEQTREEAQGSIRDYFQNYFSIAEGEEKKKEFLNKIYYVRSEVRYQDLGLGSSIVLKYVGRDLRGLEGGLDDGSDGLILTRDQKLDSIGNDLGVLHNIDHLSLTISGFNSKSDRSREAFTRALLEQIYEVKEVTN